MEKILPFLMEGVRRWALGLLSPLYAEVPSLTSQQ